MRKRQLLVLSNAAALGALLSASSAFAHIDLLDPPARAHGTAASGDTDIDVNTNQKSGPCGQVTNGRTTDRVTTYAPGQTITVQVREETNHDSYIRVSIDNDGDDDFQDRTAVGGPAIAPETQEVAQAAEEALDSEHLLRVYREFNTMNGFVHQIDVTLPNETCDNCTLQVVQLMYNSPQVYYYQCADIVIAASGGTPAAADAGVGGEGGSANAGEAGAAGEGGAGGAPSSSNGGTSSAGATSNPPPAASGGTGGTSSAGAGGRPVTAGAGGTAAVATGDSGDDGGCTISTHTTEGQHSLGLFSLLALGVGLVARRRR